MVGSPRSGRLLSYLVCRRLKMRLQRKSVQWFVLVCLSLPLGLAIPRGVFGQATTGTISGVVSDPTPGTVPGAVVAVRNLDTNATHSVTTEADGRFNFPGLPVGPYEITLEKAGFGKYKQGPIVLLLNQVAVVNVTLKPATVSETVTVTEDAPLLNTTNPEVGVRFDSKRISDLPTNPPGGHRQRRWVPRRLRLCALRAGRQPAQQRQLDLCYAQT